MGERRYFFCSACERRVIVTELNRMALIPEMTVTSCKCGIQYQMCWDLLRKIYLCEPKGERTWPTPETTRKSSAS
jgi:hypothetical protein